ncbi:hypothetical protein RJ641_022197, partial [Dillenia turbinata]
MLLAFSGKLSVSSLLLISSVILRFVDIGSAGTTSTFIRSEWPSADIPLDNEAFAIPKGHNAPQQEEVLPFKQYLHRYSTPFIASKSSNPLWYAIRRASAHIIVLSSYSPFDNAPKLKCNPIALQYRISNIHYNITTGDRYPVPDKSAPVYVTVGDGGNQEGLAG